MALICFSCGGDTDTSISTDATEPAHIIEIKTPNIYTETDKVYADFDIVFSSPPMNLEVEAKQSTLGTFIDWEQQRNIVTLSFKISELGFYALCEAEAGEGEINVGPRLIYFDVVLAWNVGRKRISLEVNTTDAAVACEEIN